MRAMIKTNAAGGYSIMLVPENDTDKYNLDRQFSKIGRSDVVKATIHSGNSLPVCRVPIDTHEVHIRLIGESFPEPNRATQTDSDVAFNRQALNDGRDSER